MASIRNQLDQDACTKSSMIASQYAKCVTFALGIVVKYTIAANGSCVHACQSKTWVAFCITKREGAMMIPVPRRAERSNNRAY